MLSNIYGTEMAYAATLLNISNSTSTLESNSSILNNMGPNSTAPNANDSILEDDESGSIASLPGKCLGSALCPD